MYKLIYYNTRTGKRIGETFHNSLKDADFTYRKYVKENNIKDFPFRPTLWKIENGKETRILGY